MTPKDEKDDDQNPDESDDDTLSKDLSSGIHWIKVKGKSVLVKCDGSPVVCRRFGTKKEVVVPDKATTKSKVHKSHARAPNGAYWKFDCNFIQKMIY